MPHTPLISVIIPVYNVEKYLRQCLGSVLVQTYTNLEIIIPIDLESKDGCPEICHEYTAADSRVKVLHRANAGLADARNAGIDAATGEYITFIDSDDWIAPDMIEFLYKNLTQHSADISCCGEYRCYVGNIIPHTYEFFLHPLVLTNIEAAVLWLSQSASPSAYARLYKKYIFDNIRYPTGELYEDDYVIIDVLMAAKIISFDPAPKYYYRQRKSGLIYASSYTGRAAQKIRLGEMRQSRIEKEYPSIAATGRASLCRRYIRVAGALISEGTYINTPEGYEILTSLFRKIRDFTKSSFDINFFTKKERISIRILTTFKHSDKAALFCLKIQRKLRKYKQRIHTKRKNKSENTPAKLVMYE